ncbi:MAG: toxin-antitoxin system HicB family antitoxin, partial [Terracoccus sp.]
MSVTIPDVTHYTYRVTWSSEDSEFVGTCLEFPSLSWLADTQDQALHGIRDVVRDVVKDLDEAAEPIPGPISSRAYS